MEIASDGTRRDEGLASRILDALFDASSAAVELYDARGALLDINAASLAIFGIDDKREIADFEFFSDPNITPARRAEIEAGRGVSYETTIDFDEVRRTGLFKTRKSGKVRLSVRIVPVLDGAGRLERILFVGDELR